MKTVFVEYDLSGELFHVCEIETTEGSIPTPPFDADAKTKSDHANRVSEAIASRAAETRAELEAHKVAGKRLIVLPDGAEKPEIGRHRVVNDRVVKRSNAEFDTWKADREKANKGLPNA